MYVCICTYIVSTKLNAKLIIGAVAPYKEDNNM